jgi:uncharacterized membrane protein YfcA
MQLTVGQGGGADDGLKIFSPWRSAMSPATSLKFSAVLFTVLWIGWMLWWSGSFDWANVIILTVSGIVAGYLWYRVMRWYFQRRGLLPRNQHRAGSA